MLRQHTHTYVSRGYLEPTQFGGAWLAAAGSRDLMYRTGCYLGIVWRSRDSGPLPPSESWGESEATGQLLPAHGFTKANGAWRACTACKSPLALSCTDQGSLSCMADFSQHGCTWQTCTSWPAPRGPGHWDCPFPPLTTFNYIKLHCSITVEPLNKDTFWTSSFVICREVVLF